MDTERKEVAIEEQGFVIDLPRSPQEIKEALREQSSIIRRRVVNGEIQPVNNDPGAQIMRTPSTFGKV